MRWLRFIENALLPAALAYFIGHMLYWKSLGFRIVGL